MNPNKISPEVFTLAHSLYRSLFLTLIFLAVANIASHAQRTFGVQWEVPQNTDTALEQLQTFDEAGISVIELTLPVPPEVWNQIDQYEFSVYGNLEIEYPIADTFSTPDSALITTIQKQASTLLSQSSLQAIGLAEYGAIQSTAFRKASAPFVSELKQAGIPEIYFTASAHQPLPENSLFADFIIREIQVTLQDLNNFSISNNTFIRGYHFVPSTGLEDKISVFKQFLNATNSASDNLIFVNSSWLLRMIEMHPQFKSTLQSLARKSEAIFPAPDESLPVQRQSAVPIILLLLIWATVGLHYNNSPLYRKSLFRYFTGHRFFIDDVLRRRHIRSAYPALILLLQNSFSIALAVYISSDTLFTSRGFDALAHYFPTVTMMGSSSLGLASWAFILSIAVAFISIIWLYISHKRINSVTQIATVYSWPLHLNLLICTIGITFFVSGGSAFAIVILTLLAIVIQLLSFIVASFDAFRSIVSGSLLFIFLTIGIYLPLLSSLFIWISTTGGFREAITLSISL